MDNDTITLDKAACVRLLAVNAALTDLLPENVWKRPTDEEYDKRLAPLEQLLSDAAKVVGDDAFTLAKVTQGTGLLTRLREAMRSLSGDVRGLIVERGGYDLELIPQPGGRWLAQGQADNGDEMEWHNREGDTPEEALDAASEALREVECPDDDFDEEEDAEADAILAADLEAEAHDDGPVDDEEDEPSQEEIDEEDLHDMRKALDIDDGEPRADTPETIDAFWERSGKPTRLINRTKDLEIQEPEVVMPGCLGGKVLCAVGRPNLRARMPWVSGSAEGWEVG